MSQISSQGSVRKSPEFQNFLKKFQALELKNENQTQDNKTKLSYKKLHTFRPPGELPNIQNPCRKPERSISEIQNIENAKLIHSDDDIPGAIISLNRKYSTFKIKSDLFRNQDNIQLSSILETKEISSIASNSTTCSLQYSDFSPYDCSSRSTLTQNMHNSFQPHKTFVEGRSLKHSNDVKRQLTSRSTYDSEIRTSKPLQ